MKIALIGNQNSGKTTLFNLLTGSNQKIGNWPGVTIEKKRGIIKDTAHEIIDLPGIYSLSSYSQEERISRDYIFSEKPDLLINIVDSTSIERSLYLTTQLMELDIPFVIALNMTDLLEKKGIEINENILSKELGVKVIKISSLKNTGIKELKEALENNTVSPKSIFDQNIENTISYISKQLNVNHKRFYSVKILDNDDISKNFESKFENEIKELSSKYDNDLDSVIADQRYKYISKIKEQFVNIKEQKESISDKLDKIFLNKWAALPIFALIMFAIYYLSVGVIGSLTVDLVDSGISSLGEWVGSSLADIGTSSWLISLIVDGIIAGVGAVLNFVPQLIILFTCIALLETTGYMSRIAFFLDILFKKIGLSGKTLIPFIVGSGCSVPGIMATRTIENNDEREMSVILTPFIPCSAKLPIIALFASYFFPNNSGIFSASFYFLSIIIIILLAYLLKKYMYTGKSSTFISELPEYKLPSGKYILTDVANKTTSFIKRAGTVILLSSIILWFALSFSFKLEYGVDIENSILANIGKALSWIFYPIIGELSWGATVSAIQGLVAKEQVVSSMAIIANMSEETLNSTILFTESGAFSFFNGVSAYAYVAFNLFSIPCFGAVGAIKRELGSTKKTLFAIGIQFVVAWALASLIFLIGSLFGL